MYFESSDDEILSAEILEFAHEYQSNDFPNPHRADCPPEEDLLKFAGSDELPNAELREHLLSCSPCFLDFHAARQAKAAAPLLSETKSPKEKSSWFGFFLRPFPVAVLLLLFCVSTGIILYNLLNRTNTEIARQENINQTGKVSENPPGSPNASIFPPANKEAEITQPSPKQNNLAANKQNKSSKTDSENDSKMPVQKTINLDLAKASVLRNQTSSETVYALPPQTVALNVKLPEGSPAGNYEVSLLDEFGKPLVKSQTKKSDGKNLTVKLNLRKERGRARLCVAPEGEIPDCFAVTVGRAE